MYYAIFLENVFTGEETEILVKTDDIESYLECNSDFAFQDIQSLEVLTEEEYFERGGE